MSFSDIQNIIKELFGKKQSQLFQIEDDKETADAVEATVIKSVRNFAFSPSSLNSYLSCKSRFYYECLLGISGGKNAATEFGSAMHYALEVLFKRMQLHEEKEFPEMGSIGDIFTAEMEKGKLYFDADLFESRKEYGLQVLQGYLENYHSGFNKIVSIEKFIRGVNIKGVPLKGKIDKLEFDGNRVKIVDYKTGNHGNIRKQLQGPNQDLPLGGSYWRQGVFYKLLVDNFPGKKWIATDVEFDFLEPDPVTGAFVKYTFQPGENDTTTLTQLLEESYRNVLQFKVFDECSNENCLYCQAARQDAIKHQVQERLEASSS